MDLKIQEHKESQERKYEDFRIVQDAKYEEIKKSQLMIAEIVKGNINQIDNIRSSQTEIPQIGKAKEHLKQKPIEI